MRTSASEAVILPQLAVRLRPWTQDTSRAFSENIFRIEQGSPTWVVVALEISN